jgi:anti-anti-sigma factor
MMDQPAGSPGRRGAYPVRWAGRQAVVALPEHIGHSNAGQVSEQLLSVINHGADALIVDMTATISCDYTGADALLRARQRAVANGTQLRLAVTDRIVRRTLSLSGLNHLISSYPSLEAAIAASEPAAAAGPPDRDDGPAITAAVLLGLLEALDDGVAVADRDGTLVLASKRLEEMFGYQHAELLGHRVDSLIPDGLREARPGHGTAFAQATAPRPAGTGARLAGARKDGARFPVEVRSTPLHTPAAQFTLTIIRDVTGNRPQGPADLARPAAAGEQARDREPAASVIAPLSHAEPGLRAALEWSRDAARPRIIEALRHLTDGIRILRRPPIAGVGPPAASPGLRQAPGTPGRWDQDEVP